MPVSQQSPTDQEQLLLELANRMRMNPAGEFDTLIANASTSTAVQANITSAISYFGVNLTSFRDQMLAYTAVAPLAWNGALAQAADQHTELMIVNDSQSHQLPGEASLGARITAAGYTGWTSLSENVYAYAQDPLYAHAGFVIDWGYDSVDFSGSTLLSNWRTLGDGIQDPAGHRVSLMRAGTTEVGISVIAENNSSTSVGPLLVTQDFGSRQNYAPQLVGVVINDIDGDDFYDIGEGLGGITITATGTAGTFSTSTWSSGGYQMVLPAGTYSVKYEGGALTGRIVTHAVTIGSQNVKQDAFVDESVPVGNLRIVGTNAAEQLTGYAGSDTIYGDGFESSYSLPQAQQVWRLYQTMLDRAPDTAGLAEWTSRLAQGNTTLAGVAQGFVASNEFRATYGALNDQEFVTLLYRNVLDREPDSGGLANWVGSLTAGMSRASVALGFSESRELVTGTLSAATSFVQSRTDAGWTDDVYRLYRATLDREPDPTGFNNWVNNLSGGTTLSTAVTGFTNSTEFKNTYGNLDDRAFVTLLYSNVLNRAPDAGGLTNWLGMLSNGMSRSDVVLGFAQSREFVAGTAQDVKDFVRGLGAHDEIRGGGGSNTLWGGQMADTFIFEARDGGQDRVMDLEAWDYLSFQGFGYADAGDIRAHLVQSGADVAFQDQGVNVTLVNTQLAALTDDMFVF